MIGLFLLMAGLVIPNLSLQKNRELRHEAERLSAQLELARQRSVVTGIPHQLRIDLEAAAYRLEWQAGGEEDEASVSEIDSERAGYDAYGQAPLDLSPPLSEVRDFEPLPGMFGRFTELPDSISFSGVETPEGWSDRGEVFIRFDRDGTTSETAIVLEGADGASLTLDVLFLAEAVQIRDDAL